MSIAIIAFSQQGYGLGERLTQQLGERASLACGSRLLAEKRGIPLANLAEWTKTAFAQQDFLIFIGATGIAVRAIAPHIRSKTTDPGVLCMDEGGRFVISLLSGHIGGANALTQQVAELLQAEPVITTATDGRGIFAVDSWATLQGLTLHNPHRIKGVSAKLLAGEEITIKSEIPLVGKLPQGITLWVCEEQGSPDVVITREQPTGESALVLQAPLAITTLSLTQ